MEFRRATLEDIPAILDVQAANFIGNLEDVERRDGFLSVMYETLQREVAGRYDIGVGLRAASKPAAEKT